jgi:hypothetical protein
MGHRVGRNVCAQVLALIAGGCVCTAALGIPITGTLNVRQISANNGGNADADLNQDIQFMNACYRQVGIGVVQSSTATINGVNTYDDSLAGNPVTGAGGLFTLQRGNANEFHVYYVRNYIASSGGSPPGQAWSDEDQRSGGVSNISAIMPPTNNAGPQPGAFRYADTVSHEAYHVLVDRFRLRRFDDVGTSGIHSNVAAWISTASNTRNIATNTNQIAPDGNRDQIPFAIGRIGTTAVRQPMITAMYNNSGGGPAPRADAGAVNTNLISNIQRADTQLWINQNNSTRQVGGGTFGWGTTQEVVHDEAFGQGTRTYRVDQLARVLQGGNEQIGFFITSGSGLSAGGSLGNGWGFSGNFSSVTAPYTGYIPNSIEVRMWSDILYDGSIPGFGITDGQGGAGILLDPTHYSWSVVTNAFGQVSFQLSVPTVNGFDLAGYRDFLVTFNMAVPTPGVASVLGLAGLVASRRRRA